MDTDPYILEQLQGVLRRDNYNVSIAADGNAALRLVNSQKPDLIISDLLLAGLDGYMVWETIRKTSEIPILAVSALIMPPAHKPCQLTPDGEWQTLYYDACLPKPVDLGRFVRVVRKLINPKKYASLPTGSSVVVAIEDIELRVEIAKILEGHNFGVKLPETFSEILRLVRGVPPAALILDYRQQNEMVRELIFQIKRLVSNTAIMLITAPDTVDDELQIAIQGIIPTPLHADYSATVIKMILETTSNQQRNQALTHQLITTSKNLMESQQALRAQNEELQHINEQLRELDKLKESFTGMVVHDLKSPLSAVLGAINFTLIDPRLSLNDRNEGMLQGAMGAGNQMLRLIETLLEGQRLQDGRVELDVEPFAWIDIITESLHNISPLLTLHRLEAKILVSNDLPLVYADPHLSQRILENLLDNAIKFSPRDTAITIEATIEDKFIKMNVQDFGPGIPKEQQKEIFNRFAQLKNSDRTVSRAGFGLGLAFCHQATEAMGGSIWVESDGTSGTTFHFTLPIYEEF
jgi:signal transduction histidine kinase